MTKLNFYSYNNGDRVEIRDDGSVFVIPNNAQLELIK